MTLVNWIFGAIALLATFDVVMLYVFMGMQKRINTETRGLVERAERVVDILERSKVSGPLPIRIITEHE